jgi:hypothetical protein
VVVTAVLRYDQPVLGLRYAASEAAVSPPDTAPSWSRLDDAATAVGCSVEVVAAGREFVVLFPVSPERA